MAKGRLSLCLAVCRRAGGAPIRTDLYVFAVPFWNAGYDEFRDWWNARLGSDGGASVVCIANAHTLNLVCRNRPYGECLRQADVVVNDGFGYRIASRIRGHHTQYNFNGTDLFPRLFCELSQPLRVFLYGATEESNARTAEKLEARFPMVKVVGHLHGYGPREEAIAQINACSPDLLLVALGQPKQELFVVENRHRINAKIMVGVGGLFDFLSGSKSRAPKWVRDVGFEWLYRLSQEPRRLFRRYVIGNPVFLVRCLYYLRRDLRLGSKINVATAENKESPAREPETTSAPKPVR